MKLRVSSGTQNRNHSHSTMVWLVATVLTLLVLLGATCTAPVAAMTAHPVSHGRITGTVINQSTGAPAPGIAVDVGGRVVYSDRHGNYERNLLPAGDYTVALVVAPEYGIPAQDPLTLTVEEESTVVQHLFFTQTGERPAPSENPEVDPNASLPPPRIAVVQPGETRWVEVGAGIGVFFTSDDLDQQITLKTQLVSPDAVPPPNPGESFVGNLTQVFVLDAQGDIVPDVTFENPIEIHFPGLAGLAPEDQPESLTVSYYDPELGVWINMPTVVLLNGNISGFTRHLTLFALSLPDDEADSGSGS